jgi:putative transposase
VAHQRRPFLTDPLARRCLREAVAAVRRKRPFEIVAWVLLPDHLHTIWTLPSGDDKYATRWRRIKEEFTEAWLAAGGSEGPRSRSRLARNERGIWQRRFWEHTCEDEHDFERHFDYIHYNAVKHGYVACPRDWPHSTFHRWAKCGVYEPRWGCASDGRLDFDDLDETAME